jgi:hypothetical protein
MFNYHLALARHAVAGKLHDPPHRPTSSVVDPNLNGDLGDALQSDHKGTGCSPYRWPTQLLSPFTARSGTDVSHGPVPFWGLL